MLLKYIFLNILIFAYTQAAQELSQEEYLNESDITILEEFTTDKNTRKKHTVYKKT
jgi:hypothetical protein